VRFDAPDVYVHNSVLVDPNADRRASGNAPPKWRLLSFNR